MIINPYAFAAGGADFKVGSFTKSNTTGTQAITGIGFTPKAILFWLSGSHNANGVWDTNVFQTIGFTSGTSESYSISGASVNNSASSDTYRSIAAAAITLHFQGLVRYEANLNSFDSDGFTLNWTTNGTGGAFDSQQIMYLAIGGAGVSAKVVNWTSPTATGNKAVTGVGFTPDVVLHGSVFRFGTIPESTSQMLTMLGAMDGSGNQWVNTVTSEDNVGTSNTYRYQRTNKTTAYIAQNTGAVIEESSFVSMDADGFTVNFSPADSGTVSYISLCLSGVDAKVGNFAISTSPQSITGVGFRPSAVLTSNIHADPATTVQDNATWSLGAADGTNQRAVGQQNRDNVSTTEANSVWNNDAFILLPDPFSPSTIRSASLDSFDADGFTHTWSTHSFTREVLYLALR